MASEIVKYLVAILVALVTTLLTTGVLAIFRLRRDVDHLRTTTEPVVTWWLKTSMDALKLATNPTSERLAKLADKYRASVIGERHPEGEITAAEKQELMNGLREVMNDGKEFAHKRQSASMSLRFIETREGLTAVKKPEIDC